MFRSSRSVWSLAVVALIAGRAHAQEGVAPPSNPAAPAKPKVGKTATVAPVNVTASRHDDTPAKLDHIMAEVAGTKIVVTKKTNVTKLDQLPTVIDDNQQQLFARSPGVLVAQQQTPTGVNLSYRGLGDPNGSRGVLVLQDGVPIANDWIGAPALAFLPLPQGVATVEELRGGSGLTYGPEPASINLVSRRPKPGEPLTGYTEQVGGGDGLYSTYNVLEGTHGPYEFRADLGYIHSDGQRQNAQSEVRQGDLYLGYRPDGKQLWYLDFHAYDAEAGRPGGLSYGQFKSDPDAASTPFGEDWVSRYSLVLGHEQDFDGGWHLEGKLWAAYQDVTARGADETLAAPPPAATSLQDAIYRSEGLDLRLRRRYGRGNAFTVGVDAYHDDSPLRQWTTSAPLVAQDDHSGPQILNQSRSSSYEAVFAENVWRLPYRFHLVPSVRIEHEDVSVDESVRPPALTRPLQHAEADRALPLFGLGFGNDFGRQNETYFSVTQGWRPTSFVDLAPPFANTLAGRNLTPLSRSLSFEGGVHGTPLTGLFYDADLFWIDQTNRIETLVLPNGIDTQDQNSGDTRNRGFEGELSYDFLAARPGGEHLSLFANLQLLDARFTRSDIPGQVGKTPAYAPHVLGKYGIAWREDGRYSLSLTGVSVSSQFFQDSDLPNTAGPFVPARIPGYTQLDVAGDWYLTRKVRLLGGISNLGDVRYYSRATQAGIEPAPGRVVYGGVALGF